MRILALDLATTTGWAFWDSQGAVSSGVKAFKTSRFQSAGTRFLLFQRWLSEMIEVRRPDVVAFEAVRRHLSTDSAHAYGGFLAFLQSQCEEMGVQYYGIGVGTIKKHATGKGNASKDEMIAAAQTRFPEQKIIDDNQADALWVLETARDQLLNRRTHETSECLNPKKT